MPVPPGRVTRAISDKPRRQSGNMITPKIEKTASKAPSGSARACPSITRASTFGRPAAAMRATIPGEKSVASTWAPVRAAARASAPVPAATSSTRLQASRGTRARAASAKRAVKGWAVSS
jgi:hypothetical protein